MLFYYLELSHSRLLTILIPAECFLINTKNDTILLITSQKIPKWNETDNLKKILDEFSDDDNQKLCIFQELMK